MATGEILPHLPPYGPLPKLFRPGGQGRYQEGLVVEFRLGAEQWIGNFLRGVSRLDLILPHPDGHSILIIAGGTGYVLNASTQEATLTFGPDVVEALVDTENGQIICVRYTCIEAYGATGLSWRTRQLSWDGFRSVRIDQGKLLGQAWTFERPEWVDFCVRLSSGEASGESYHH